MTHPCYARGCEVETRDYYCSRHQAIAEERRARDAQRASERALERRIESNRATRFQFEWLEARRRVD